MKTAMTVFDNDRPLLCDMTQLHTQTSSVKPSVTIRSAELNCFVQSLIVFLGHVIKGFDCWRSTRLVYHQGNCQHSGASKHMNNRPKLFMKLWMIPVSWCFAVSACISLCLWDFLKSALMVSMLIYQSHCLPICGIIFIVIFILF